MIRTVAVNYIPTLRPYKAKLRECDICGNTINLNSAFSRAMEISWTTMANWGGSGSNRGKQYPVKNILYTHPGNCETMAVLQVSNEDMG